MRRKNGTSKFSFAFIYNNNIFGVWSDYKEGKMYVSYDYDKNSPFMYAMTLKDHTPNTMMFNAIRKYNFWKEFLQNYKLGNVFFENQKIKHDVYELIKLFHSSF